MPRLPIVHPVWSAYELLTTDLGISHDDALHRLWETFPGLPVDLIVSARGDMAKTLEELTGTPAPVRPDTGKPDPRAVRNRLREVINGQQDGEPDPGDFNAAIRARAAERSGGATAMMTPADVVAAGSGKATPETSYDPAADPIRARFAERYG